MNRPFKNASGENEADFIMVQVWRKPAENAANFVKKGSQAAVNGRISTRHYRKYENECPCLKLKLKYHNVGFYTSTIWCHP